MNNYEHIQFQNILTYNGAIIVNTLKDLTTVKDKNKIILLDSDNLSQKRKFLTFIYLNSLHDSR